MKNIKIKDATVEQLAYFDNIIQPILKYLDENWDLDGKPKDYDNYVKSYEQNDDMGEMIPDFDGLLDTSTTHPTLPEMLSLPQVAYSDTQQGRNPLETLVGTLIGYGMAVGKELYIKDELESDIILKKHDALIKKWYRVKKW